MNHDAIDADHRSLAVVEEGADAALVRAATAPHPLAMLDANTPEEYMDRISRVCKILVDVVEKQKLAKKLGRGEKKHVELEAWQFLGSMPWIRCAAIIEWTKEVGGDGSGLGWEARAQVYRDGSVVGAGDGMCLRSEANWKSPKDYFALRSMAQSRAMSRALQGPLRFIFVLAGYAGAGSEEMPADAATEARAVTPTQKPPIDADTPEARAAGIKAVHTLARKHGVDLDSAESPYRKLLLSNFEVFCDPEVEVSSKALSAPELRELYRLVTEHIREAARGAA
jgi:hypothetical protein